MAAILDGWLFSIPLVCLIIFGFAAFDARPGEENFRPAIWTAAIVISYVPLILAFGYFDGSPRGGTPAKRLLGIRVVDASTREPIGFRRGILRATIWLLGMIPLYLGSPLGDRGSVQADLA